VNKSSPETNEKNVLQNYLKDYDKRVRPKPENNRPIVVKLSVDTVKLVGYVSFINKLIIFDFAIRIVTDFELS